MADVGEKDSVPADKEIGSSPAAMEGQDEAVQAKVHDNVVEHARLAAEKEQNMTLLQGIKLYPKAIFFSVVISTCIVMEGYDISLINNFCKYRNSTMFSPRSCMLIVQDAFTQFNEKYGEQLPDGTWEIPARWQSGLSNVSSRPRHVSADMGGY